LRKLISELRAARQAAGMSQRALAEQLDWSQSEVNRLEQLRFMDVAFRRLAEIGSVLGLELGAGFRPVGDALRDKGHQAVIRRFLAIVATPPYVFAREVLLPGLGDRRSWDVLLRVGQQLVGVEVETRARDMQALVRRTRERERDGGVDEVLVVLANTVYNRAVAGQLREALGPRFATSPRSIQAALRAGRPVPGSGVILV
jgi:transcriptional regulator with XRE-family HTH domain